jgi:hypothetical protein
VVESWSGGNALIVAQVLRIERRRAFFLRVAGRLQG